MYADAQSRATKVRCKGLGGQAVLGMLVQLQPPPLILTKTLFFRLLCVTQTHGERSDDQTRGGSQVLVAIDVVRVGGSDETVVQIRVPVVAEVLHPLKILGPTHLHNMLM